VAGIIGGATHGVAPGVLLHSVRVFGCGGSGTYSDVIAGLDWIIGHHQKPAVANMSLGGPAYEPLDEAVRACVAAGVTVVASAGNDGGESVLRSPARVPEAVTVGATDRTDTRAPFSSYGPVVDLFAPGVNVESASFWGDSEAELRSGTSMSAALASGAAALWLETQPAATPAEVQELLRSRATDCIVRSAGPGTTRRMLFTGESPDLPAVVGLEFGRAVVPGSLSTAGRVRLRCPAPEGGVRVDLANTNPAAAVPRRVWVPAGAASRAFTILTAPVAERRGGRVTATLNDSDAHAWLVVRPIGVARLAPASSTVEGGTAVRVALGLEAPAAPGSITVRLSSDRPEVCAPASETVTIPEGASGRTVWFRSQPVGARTAVRIRAEAPGASASAVLTVTP